MSWAIRITGVPGSGKSALARAAPKATATADVLFVAERFHRHATIHQEGRPPCESATS